MLNMAPGAEGDSDRQAAYTGLRSDVFEFVPADARRILDVGCSNGVLGGALRSAVPDRFVVGVEYDRALAAEAEGRLDKVICGDANTLDWASVLTDSPFDCVIFADVLEHTVEPWRILESVLRAVRPGGTVIVSVPNIRHVSAIWSIVARGTFPRRSRGIFDSTHLRWFTRRDITQLMEEHGLMISSIDYGLRVGDRGGGLVNRVVKRVLEPIAAFPPIAEFLTYQFCIRSVKR